MNDTPMEVVRQFLEDSADSLVLGRLVAQDATYVSLNYENGDLKGILTRTGICRTCPACIDAFSHLSQDLQNQTCEIRELFATGENVAVRGVLTRKPAMPGRSAATPFSIWAKVRNRKIVYLQFMEETVAPDVPDHADKSWRIRRSTAAEAVEF